MAKLRLVHARTTTGNLYITDIDSGLPNEMMPARLHKQEVYVPYSLQTITAYAPIVVTTDAAVPGYIDLVLSDKVQLSFDRGVIRGLADLGYLTTVMIPAGGVSAPTVATATEDTLTSATSATNDGLLTVTGTGFTSLAPYVSTITIVAPSETQVFTAAEVILGGGVFTATSIQVPAAVHGLLADGTDDITSITVSSNAQTATLAVTII